MRFAVSVLALLGFCAQGSERMRLVRPEEFPGLCDASAAVALGSNHFVVASDENNTLCVYPSDHPGPPAKSYNLDSFLKVSRKSPEADIEAVARLGDRLFWIGSHGRNKNAKERLNRCQLFATDISTGPGGEVTLVPAGKPYTGLLLDFAADPRLLKFNLNEADERAPKAVEGLNIEGLSATPEGELLIGFRNPIPEGKALLVPLQNPNQVLGGQRGRLGPPKQLDLGGLGIRDMVLNQQTYIIIAGSYRGGGEFRLYRWEGGEAKPEPVLVEDFGDYNPEAIIIYPEPGAREFQVLSDDGERLIGGVAGKNLEPARQKFRSFWLVPEN